VQQSPIDLGSASGIEKLKLFLKYPKVSSSFQLYNNGYSIALTLPESYKGGFGLGEKLDDMGSEDAQAYKLWQVNFHAPSEHTLKGKQMPLEMQFMHQRVTGGSAETAVVVVLFQEAANRYHDLLDKLMADGLPGKAWEEKSVASGIDFGDVMGGAPFYKYTGSLTVPPCESGVKYYIRQDPISAAHSQLRKFQKALKDTCQPRGNFRLVRPHIPGAKLTLVPSVDVIKDPDTTVKPSVSKVEKAEEDPLIAAEKKAEQGSNFHCPATFIDEEMANMGRIQVGDSPEFIAAKERFNRNKRELQVAEGAEGNAELAYKLQQKLYNDAPGWAEKINLKWSLEGAKAVKAGAKSTLADLAGHAQEELTIFTLAIYAECKRLHDLKVAEEEARKAAEPQAPAPPPPPPPAPPPKFEYPEPHVKLRRGMAASPFASGKEDTAPTESGISADEGDAQANPARVAPNLHQPDVPPSATIEKAKTLKDVKVKKGPPREEIIMTVDLPVDIASIPSKAGFKFDFVEALAESVEIPASRLKVTKLEGHTVAKVHGSYSLAQRTLRGSV